MKDLEKVFSYNGSEIAFNLGHGDVMVNATQMGKAFAKYPAHFLRNEQTVGFIGALRNRIATEPVRVINGDNGGTWMHQKLALKFAAWLSADFELWVYDRVEELLKYGATAINPEDLLNPDYVIRVMTALKEERAQKELAQAELKEQAPKVALANAISETNGAITMGEFAKLIYDETKMGRNSLFKWLRDNKILNADNIPYQRYVEYGWFKLVERVWSGRHKRYVSIQTLVTGKGQIGLLKQLQKY